jgi:general secretion pathway protein K
VSRVRTLWSALKRRLMRPAVTSQRGVALIMVTVVIAVLGAVLTEFSYNTRVDLEAAANGRDLLRAEYLARSAISLSRLLIKIQTSVFEPLRKYIGDFRIGDIAPMIVKAFGGAPDEIAGVSGMLGIDASQMKGLGAGKGATFDVTMTSDDGRLNLNCGGGFNDAPRQAQLYGVLSALFWPPRYNRLFEEADADGQYSTRDDVARAILDWADIDENRFEPPIPGKGTPQSGGAENYRYDAGKDPYKAHNNFFDTLDEVHMVRGFGEEVYGSFAELLTVYGSCKVNLGELKPESWPLVAAIIRSTVKDSQKNNPILADELLLAGLAQRSISQAQYFGGFSSVNDFIKIVANPSDQVSAIDPSVTGQKPPTPPEPPKPGDKGTGIELDPAKVNKVATLGARRTYRLDAVGQVERTKERRVQVHIRAVWDTTHFNQNTTSGDANDRQGTWVYFRLD